MSKTDVKVAFELMGSREVVVISIGGKQVSRDLGIKHPKQVCEVLWLALNSGLTRYEILQISNILREHSATME